MIKNLNNNEGFAMVIALGFITVLALLAGIIVAVSTAEKKTAFNEYTFTRSFYSADAGGEAAINWLRVQNRPPDQVDDPNDLVFVPGGMTQMTADHAYKHEVTYKGVQAREGWDYNLYKDYRYWIESDGESVADSEAEVELRVLRLFKEGY